MCILSASTRAPATLGFFHLDYRFTGDHNTGSNLAPEKNQPSFAVWGASLGVTAPDETWAEELWAKNLFDHDYRQVVFDAPLQSAQFFPSGAQSFNAFLGDPRTWGIRARWNF